MEGYGPVYIRSDKNTQTNDPVVIVFPDVDPKDLRVDEIWIGKPCQSP